MPQTVNMTVIGLISGTSYDAVDAAAARMRLAGDTLFLAPLGLHSVPVPAPLRARIAAALPPHRTTVEEICRLDTTIGRLFGSVAADANAALTGGAADLVSSHGQTVYHWVDGRRPAHPVAGCRAPCGRPPSGRRSGHGSTPGRPRRR